MLVSNPITINIDPMGAPRQVRSDVWRPRPVVLRYRAFKDEMRLHVKEIPACLALRFEIAMPPSWPKKRRAEMCGRPHQSKPDIDNLTKAVMDAIAEEDAFVWKIAAEKLWAESGRITVGEIGA